MRATFIACLRSIHPKCAYNLLLRKASSFNWGLGNFTTLCGLVQVWEGWVSGEWAGGNHLYPGLWHTQEPPGVSALARQHAKSQPWVSLWIRLSALSEAESVLMMFEANSVAFLTHCHHSCCVEYCPHETSTAFSMDPAGGEEGEGVGPVGGGIYTMMTVTCYYCRSLKAVAMMHDAPKSLKRYCTQV